MPNVAHVDEDAAVCPWCLEVMPGADPPPPLRPCHPWPGAKARLAPRVLRLLHPHHSYIEPTGGSLAVLLAKPRVAVEVANDIDDHLVRFYRVLRERPDDLHRALISTPYAASEFAAAVDDPGLDDVERVRRWFVRATQTLVGSAANHTQARWIMTARGSARASGATKAATFADRVPEVAERLRRVQFTQEDAVVLLDRVLPRTDVLTAVYVDPPYLGSTRTVRYGADVRRSQWHEDLVDVLLARDWSPQVVVSGYDGPTYRRLDDAGWHREEHHVVGSGNPGRVTQRIEVLWSNRPPPEMSVPSAGRFCSEGCRRAAARARAAAKTEAATCEHCGTQFQAARIDARFCSGACRQAAYRTRLRVRPKKQEGHPTN